MNSHDLRQPSPSLQRWLTVITHFLCLGMIFILPEVIMSKSIPADVDLPWGMYVKSLIFVAVFYVNYYIIIDRCLGRRLWVWRLVGWNMIVLLVSLVIFYIIWDSHRMPGPRAFYRESELVRRAGFFVRDAVMIVLTVGLSLAMKLSAHWSSLNRQRQEMLAAQRADELRSLKNQLNPHFLFNTLNSIYALIAISPDKAQKAVHELSHLLRYVLYENEPRVPLIDELAFIDNYVRLMKLRMRHSAVVNVTLDAGSCRDCEIAPLLFISPVENAFKYGNTGRDGDMIDISIVCRDGVVTGRFSNHFLISEDAKPSQSSGIGAANLKRRLDLIYGSDADMTTEVNGDIHTVEMKIKL